MWLCLFLNCSLCGHLFPSLFLEIKKYFFPFLHPHGKFFSVCSHITSSAFAMATPPPANSSRCSPSTFLGLLLSRENSSEPYGATSPIRKTLKTTYRTMSVFCFCFFMVSKNCFAGFSWAYCPAARSLPQARSQIVDAVCPQSHLLDVMEKFIIQQWLSVGFASGPRCGDQHSSKKADKNTLKANWQVMILVPKCVLNFNGFMHLAASNSLHKRGCAWHTPCLSLLRSIFNMVWVVFL